MLLWWCIPLKVMYSYIYCRRLIFFFLMSNCVFLSICSSSTMKCNSDQNSYIEQSYLCKMIWCPLLKDVIHSVLYPTSAAATLPDFKMLLVIRRPPTRSPYWASALKCRSQWVNSFTFVANKGTTLPQWPSGCCDTHASGSLPVI